MNKLTGLIAVIGLGFVGCGEKAPPVVWPPTVRVLETKAWTGQEVEKFTGTWVMLERNDQKPANRKWVFANGTITDQNGNLTREGTFKIDPAKKNLDFLVGEEVKFVGIYEFTDGNQKLKFCGAEVPPGKDKEERRPSEFKLQKGWVLYRLERGK
jgi:hypothetical protein